MHANTMGVTAVLANGKIMTDLNMNGARSMNKNAGYDLKHMFIGSEGTLGIITECAILCHPLPTSK